MKKLGLLLSVSIVLALGALVPAAVGAHRAHRTHHAPGPVVTVTIKTTSKTLLRPTAVHGQKRSITKGGTPSGVCSGASAAGALNSAVHGQWTGKYYASLKDIFIESILGVKPSGNDYWGVFVNGKKSSTGICAIKLQAGLKLVFKITK